jgi:dynein heavy chain
MVINMLKFGHKTTRELSESFEKNEKRVTYVTPSLYMDQLYNFKRLYKQTKTKIMLKTTQYKNGIAKIIETQSLVNKLQEELTTKKPEMEILSEQVAKIQAEIEEETAKVEPVYEKIRNEEAEVNVKVQEGEMIKEECGKDLALAKPILDQAAEGLRNISPNDLILLKNMPNAPLPIRIVMEAVCILLGRPPAMVAKKDNPKQKVEDYWETSKKLYFKNFAH